MCECCRLAADLVAATVVGEYITFTSVFLAAISMFPAITIPGFADLLGLLLVYTVHEEIFQVNLTSPAIEEEY